MGEWAKRKRGEKPVGHNPAPPPPPAPVKVYTWWRLEATCLGGGDHRHQFNWMYRKKEEAQEEAARIMTVKERMVQCGDVWMRAENISSVHIEGPIHRTTDGGYPPRNVELEYVDEDQPAID